MLQGLNVLVISDDPNTRELLNDFLEIYRAKVTTLIAEEAVLVAIAQFQPDVLVHDLHKREQDGYALMHHIRNLPPQQGGYMPVVVLSGTNHLVKKTAMSNDFHSFLLKPFDPMHLIDAITRIVLKP